ncbi:DUF4342 domain-containing protein [Clostridium mediterraneense]|uniref:DUF4342 domain-containing protein n=1 Tax=Clostridium mediterraneense TaxID=1805472 RepID=UPI000830168A|nr:DUF4342 domain-containing protein [Clostridium mediterraneense]
MENITLEKVDQIIERTSVTYKDAKEALELSNGDVLEAIIYIENKQREEFKAQMDALNEEEAKKQESIEDLKKWILSLVEKGNVSRIKIKKDDKVIGDIPVNAGIAAGVIAVLLPPVLAVLAVAAVASNVVIEITKTDGSVEVVNKIIKSTASDLKEKTKGFANTATDMFKNKTGMFKSNNKTEEKDLAIVNSIKSIKKPSFNKKSKELDNSSSFSYTVNFEDIDKQK